MHLQSLVLALLLASAGSPPAPQDVTPPEVAPPDAAAIEKRLAVLEGFEELPGLRRLSPLGGAALALEREALEAALLAIALEQEAREEAARWRQGTSEAADRAAGIRDRIDTRRDAPPDTAGATEPRAVELALADARAERAAAIEQLADLDREYAERRERSTAITAAQVERQEALDRRRELLTGTPTNAVERARAQLAAAEAAALAAQLDALAAERSALESERELAPLRRADAEARLDAAERAVEAWLARSEELARDEADEAASAAQQQHAALDGEEGGLAKLAARNTELATLRTGERGLLQLVDTRRVQLAAIQAEAVDVARRYESARRRIAVGGLSEGTGSRLQRDDAELPSLAELRAERRAIARRLSELQLELIAVEEERDEDHDPTGLVQRVLREVAGDPVREATAEQLIETRRELQDEVIEEGNRLLAVLVDLRLAHDTLAADVEAYRQYIRANILWIRSTDLNPLPALLAAPAHARAAAARLVADVERAGPRSVGERSVRLSLLGLLAVALVLVRPALRRRQEALADQVRSYRTDRFAATVHACLTAALMALPVPLVLWTAGWSLAGTDGLALALGQALRAVGGILLALDFLRQFAKRRGLGQVHFRLAPTAMADLRTELAWFEYPAGILGLVALTFEAPPVNDWRDSLGRIAFVLAMVALAAVLHRVLGPRGLLAGAADEEERRSLLARSRRVWHIVGLALPLALVVLALTGYVYTAYQLERSLRYTLLLALALGGAQALALRWLFVARRRLAIEQARERARSKASDDGDDDATESGKAATVDEDVLDIPTLDAQTRQLFRNGLTLAALVGAYFIWAGALPALQGLDRVQLLPRLAVLDAEALGSPSGSSIAIEDSAPAPPTGPDAAAPTADAATAPATSSPAGSPLGAVPGLSSTATSAPAADAGDGIPSSLTLAKVLIALLIAALTAVGTRNLPSLLEIVLLQRLPLDAGARYAVTTVLRYLIAIAGISAISTTLGIGWEKIQWLAAALTFGLAFGLQEIFANFVSGLIILIERPIRVGDIVTVGTTEGRVTRLRMRATTIQDWDRREFLIPNKDFITGNVINWTLTDPVTRVVIEVGIAYGSDVAKARRLLEQVAADSKYVLDDPRPRAIFRRFGDSTLNFELRVFIANRDLWPQLVDSIHDAIDQVFRAEGVEIAFPQRDLHLRSVDEGAAARLAERSGHGVGRRPADDDGPAVE